MSHLPLFLIVSPSLRREGSITLVARFAKCYNFAERIVGGHAVRRKDGQQIFRSEGEINV